MGFNEDIAAMHAVAVHDAAMGERAPYEELAALRAERDEANRVCEQWRQWNEALRARVAELERVLDGYRGQVDRFGNSPAGEVLGASASAGTGET